MIELMLEAERAMAVGLLDQAERQYAQVVAADPRNAIAVVGLARVALERGDQRGAYTYARRALVLDPENPMASHLAGRMAEQMTARGEALPTDVGPGPATPRGATASDASEETGGDTPRRGVVDRLLRRRR
jgi:tetratricopeptide (TPR) repeat protein